MSVSSISILLSIASSKSHFCPVVKPWWWGEKQSQDCILLWNCSSVCLFEIWTKVCVGWSSYFSIAKVPTFEFNRSWEFQERKDLCDNSSPPHSWYLSRPMTGLNSVAVYQKIYKYEAPPPPPPCLPWWPISRLWSPWNWHHRGTEWSETHMAVDLIAI